MSPEEFDVTKQRLVGTWLQEFSAGARARCAWQMLPNGDFTFAWHQAPVRLKATVRSMTGRWELLDPATPRLKLTVTSVTSPAKRVIDVAYLGIGGPVNPLALVFRKLMVGATNVGATKMANSTFGFEAKVDIRNNNLVVLQRTDGRNGNPQQLLWCRH